MTEISMRDMVTKMSNRDAVILSFCEARAGFITELGKRAVFLTCKDPDKRQNATLAFKNRCLDVSLCNQVVQGLKNALQIPSVTILPCARILFENYLSTVANNSELISHGCDVPQSVKVFGEVFTLEAACIVMVGEDDIGLTADPGMTSFRPDCLTEVRATF